MKKILSLSIFACLLSLSSFAQDDSSRNYNEDDMQGPDSTMKNCSMCCKQVAVGVEAGVNIANYTYGTNNSGQLVSSNPIVRGRAGVIVDIPVHGIFYIQPGAFYAMTGATNSVGSGTWNVNTIEVPVNLELKFGCCKPISFFVGAGPYIGYNISGNITGSNGDNRSLNMGSSTNDDLKTIDFGANINGGIELTNGLLFRLRYQQGLINLDPHSAGTINSMSYGAQVGYLFGRCTKCKKAKPQQHEREERVWDQ